MGPDEAASEASGLVTARPFRESTLCSPYSELRERDNIVVAKLLYPRKQCAVTDHHLCGSRKAVMK